MTPEEKKELFMGHFRLTDLDFKYLWDLFCKYGMTSGEAPHRSKCNHIYLQAICQNYSVEYKDWKFGLTKELKTIIKEKYPQLMVQNKKFEKL